jgi:hypothetical protein
MMNEADHMSPSTFGERKQKLIAQGASYRAGVVHAKDCVNAGLRPDALAKWLVARIAGVLGAAVKGSHAAVGAAPAGLDLQTVLPLLASAAAALSKTSLPKPVTRGAAILGVIGAVAATLLKKKAARHGAGQTEARDLS